MTQNRAGKKRVALVLPGGGCNCAFQAGVLKALSEFTEKFEIIYCQGVSAGALNGAKFIEDNCRATGIVKIWRELERDGAKTLFDTMTLAYNQLGISAANRKLLELISNVDIKKIIQSPIRFDVVVRNEATNRAVIFSNHDPAQNALRFKRSLMATCSIPGFMPPVKIHHDQAKSVLLTTEELERKIAKDPDASYYSDGCIILPEALRFDFDLVIVITSEHNLDPYLQEFRPWWITLGTWRTLSCSHYNYLNTIEKGIDILQLLFGPEKLLVIRPTFSIPTLGTLSFEIGDISRFIDHGYQETRKVLKFF